ncbi:MAG: hypothetical protein A3C35_05130 [Omnitrophica bacterium RIFCSPHIGHO2_02_FULL_46_11]|nr:MAG: hypothetical protein A3C35_05130 [Omnitrophica bacterium RIFCSPHIGHO2_02_FULL_46_11]OGW86617.1 MAG: hypothetical protein A3A81_07360 [Omnitrophica bacterium RIFCSPLOWO2_01_FULL_45_10b]
MKLRSNNLRGIWFWLKWILTAIGGFTLSVLFWNWLLLRQLKADFHNPQIAIGWMVAVFGTWFVTLIPLMKKKETVMGHMDKQDESTVTWWLIWISLTIGSFFLAVWFWTPFIASRFGSIKNPTTSLLWVVAVFGSWLVALIPLMIVMYYKVDKAYEDARIRRELKAEKFKDPVKIKAVFIEESKRRLPKEVSEKLKKTPQTIKGGHLITAILKDGRKIKNVFISRGKEILGVYDQEELTFEGADIANFETADLTSPPDFTQKIWLRLDGNSA